MAIKPLQSGKRLRLESVHPYPSHPTPKPLKIKTLTGTDISNQRFLHKQCARIIDEEGKENFFIIVLPEKIKQDIHSWFPLIEGDPSLQDGLYTWVIIDYKGNKRLFLKQVFNYHEFGTKHAEIIKSLSKHEDFKDIDFQYAGELLKEGDQIKFNLESGTYMSDHFKMKKKDPENENYGTIEKKNEAHVDAKHIMNVIFNDIMHKNEITYVNNDDPTTNTFITIDTVPLMSYNDLNYLASIPDVSIYKFENQEECATFNKPEHLMLSEKITGKGKDMIDYHALREKRRTYRWVPPVGPYGGKSNYRKKSLKKKKRHHDKTKKSKSNYKKRMNKKTHKFKKRKSLYKKSKKNRVTKKNNSTM
jgi:hypothetical protein